MILGVSVYTEPFNREVHGFVATATVDLSLDLYSVCAMRRHCATIGVRVKCPHVAGAPAAPVVLLSSRIMNAIYLPSSSRQRML